MAFPAISPVTPPALITSAPPTDAVTVVRGHDRARRQRLVRLLALGVGGLSLVLLPSVFIPTFDGISCIALLIALAGSLAAYFVNRLGRVGEAGYLLLGGGTLGIAWVIAGRAMQQGLTTTDLRLYDFFVLPIVLSGVISNRRTPILLGILTASFTIVSLFLLPHTAGLQRYWDGLDPQTIGSVYDVIAIPVVIQGLTAVAAWLGADSVRRSLLSATRADELTLANERILAQAAALERHQRQLQDGIAHIQEVHTAFARGNFDVRAQIADQQLQPLALSLNVLLMHMQRLLREQGQRVRIEIAAHELSNALRHMRAGGPYIPPAYSGTAFDDVLLELAAWFQQSAPPAAGRPPSPDRARFTGDHPRQATPPQQPYPGRGGSSPSSPYSSPSSPSPDWPDLTPPS
jgi:hypothetical protein